MTARTQPPFRADHVGSLLRPAELAEARAKAKRGEITAVALRARKAVPGLAAAPLFSLLSGDETLRRRILVDNPPRLYGAN